MRLIIGSIFLFNSLFSQGFLQVDNGDIVDGTGAPILLKGLGLGGWLVPEGYMLNIPGYGSPTEIENKTTYKPIPNEKILSNFEFQADNFLSDGSLVLPDLPPYIFTIKVLEKTKVNIDSDGKVTNKIVSRGEDLRFDVKDEVRFDFWDTTHIQCYLNGTHLNNFFGTNNQSLRASFKTSDQRFYYKIYNQATY